MTSSAGRLFDAVASILGIGHYSNFEGQAAMQLEYAIDGVETDERYGFTVIRDQLHMDRARWPRARACP